MSKPTRGPSSQSQPPPTRRSARSRLAAPEQPERGRAVDPGSAGPHGRAGGAQLSRRDIHRRTSRPPEQTLALAASVLVLFSLVLAAVRPRATDEVTIAGPPLVTATSTLLGEGGTHPPTTKSTPVATPPAATHVPTAASGTTHVLTVPGQDSGAHGRIMRYTVEVEDGAGVDEAEFARTVRAVLTDKRGWETQDGVHFVNVAPEAAGRGEPVDVRITLASPLTVDKMCAPLDTEGQVSCRNGARVAINSRRWTEGVESYAGDLARYRIYLINHEVGHAVGYDHQDCPGLGKPAPVMLQQTLGLHGCTKYPYAVPGLPL